MSAEHPIAIPEVLKAQYRAGFQMLRNCIESFSDAEWEAGEDRNPTWQMAYHVLFYTHMYLQPSLGQFKAFGHHHAAQLADRLRIRQDGPDAWHNRG